MVTEQEIKNRVFTVDFESPEHSMVTIITGTTISS